MAQNRTSVSVREFHKTDKHRWHDVASCVRALARDESMRGYAYLFPTRDGRWAVAAKVAGVWYVHFDATE